MNASQSTRVGERARETYSDSLREQVETSDNFGKILFLDVDSGD